MSQHPDPRPDEAFDRLRAADPAAHLTPDGASLDAAVRSRVGDGVLADRVEPAPESSAAVAGDELAAARARRRPQRWAAVAAVAVGALAVGSTGYALGNRADGDLAAATSSTSAITLPQGGGAESADGAASAAGPAGADPRVATESLAADSAASMPWFGGRTVFSAQGLSDSTGTAEAWAYDPAQVFSGDTAARVAEALGLAGEPTLEGGTWVVGPQDGSAPSLQLQPDGVTSVSYYDPTLDPFGCPVIKPDTGGSADAAEGGGSDATTQEVAPDVPACTTRGDLGTAPQGDAAVTRAREVLAALGADPDGFDYEVADAGTQQAAYVTAHGVLGGQRTGLMWNMTLVGAGVQSLYGSLAPVVPLGTYDVVSENAAVARLSDPRFGSFLGPVLAAQEDAGALRELPVSPDGPATSGAAGDDVPAVATPPSALPAGSSFAWPVTEVVLTEARLGLAQHTQPDGATVLLPAYELSGADGATWSVVAVADTALDFSAGR